MVWGLLAGLGLKAVGALFSKKRKPPTPQRPVPDTQLKSSWDAFNAYFDLKETNLTTSASRFKSNPAFNSLPASATLGTPIPLIYCTTRLVNGFREGGVRITLPPLFTEVRSYGDRQLFRFMGMLGEEIVSDIDEKRIAVGSTLLSEYPDFQAWSYWNGGDYNGQPQHTFPEINCGTLQESLDHTGPRPVAVPYVLGSGIGTVELDWWTYNHPESPPARFVVIWNGKTVIDTGYRATHLNYDDDLDALGYPRQSTLGSSPHSFRKDAATPTTATVLVYVPIPLPPGWTVTLGCPAEDPPPPAGDNWTGPFLWRVEQKYSSVAAYSRYKVCWVLIKNDYRQDYRVWQFNEVDDNFFPNWEADTEALLTHINALMPIGGSQFGDFWYFPEVEQTVVEVVGQPGGDKDIWLYCPAGTGWTSEYVDKDDRTPIEDGALKRIYRLRKNSLNNMTRSFSAPAFVVDYKQMDGGFNGTGGNPGSYVLDVPATEYTTVDIDVLLPEAGDPQTEPWKPNRT